MAVLDIIVTHADEPWSVGRKMFEMLRVQRGIRDGEFRVILVQDGEETGTDLTRIMQVFTFVDSVLYIPKGGVSAARNEGLSCATAPWVMFCDFDDCLYSADSLRTILDSLETAPETADIVWGEIWIEGAEEDGSWCKTLKGWNSVFIHGKCYRREFLEDRGLRFDEELTYSEDAMFNALCVMETKPKRIIKMPEPVYMWCRRPESASNYTGGEAKRNLSLYRKRVKLCEAYAERGREYDARAAATRILLEYYWELNGQDSCPGHTREEWIRRLREDVIQRWPGAIGAISPGDRSKIFMICEEDARLKGLTRDGMPDPEDWLREIGALDDGGKKDG